MRRYLHDRITVDSDVCGGKPTIRGKRLAVQTVLGFLVAGDAAEEIMQDYEFLEIADIEACRQFALEIALETLSRRVYLGAA